MQRLHTAASAATGTTTAVCATAAVRRYAALLQDFYCAVCLVLAWALQPSARHLAPQVPELESERSLWAGERQLA
jgi:hypothetical protein